MIGTRALSIVVAVVAAAVRLSAATVYLADQNAIQIYDWPSPCPCSPEQLLLADKINGWNKVSFDPATRTWTVDANLIIGRNDGSETLFLVREGTVAVRGNVTVYPYWIQGENAPNDRFLKKRVNRLALGDPDNAAAKAALRIFADAKARNSLYVGVLPDKGRKTPGARAYGGELLVYNSAIGAAVPDADHMIGAEHLYLRGSRIELVNAEIANVRGVAGFYLGADNSRLENVVFADSGYGLINSRQNAKNCVFKNLNTAVLDWGGPIEATLDSCRFENNRQNFSLRRGWIDCVDCDFGAPKLPDTVAMMTPAKKDAPVPVFTSSRHIVVAVTDADGKAVPNAAVVAICADTPDAARLNKAKTGPDGLTPGQGGENALLLKEFETTATADPKRPARKDFRYVLRATAPDGRSGEIPDAVPHQSWKRFAITLKP